MTRSGGSLLHEWVAAGDAADFDAFNQYLHDDVIVHAPLGLSTTNIEAEKEAWKAALRAIPDIRHEIQETVTDGSTIVARVVVTGTHRGEFVGVPGTGKTFRIDQAIFAHVRDGKAAEIWEIVDSAAFLEQIGASSL
jgi:steroid delta-isomerase-like uncharacterized protein